MPLDATKGIALSEVQNDVNYLETIRIRSEGQARLRIESNGSSEFTVKGVSGSTGESISASAGINYGFLDVEIPPGGPLDYWVINIPRAFVDSVRMIDAHTEGGDILVKGEFGDKVSGRAPEMRIRSMKANVRVEFTTFPGKITCSTLAHQGLSQIANSKFVEAMVMALNGRVEASDTYGKLSLIAGGGSKDDGSSMQVWGLHKSVEADVMRGFGQFNDLNISGDLIVHSTVNSLVSLDKSSVLGKTHLNVRGLKLNEVPQDKVLIRLRQKEFTAGELLKTAGKTSLGDSGATATCQEAVKPPSQ